MDALVKSDLFFFVTGSAVIVLTLVLLVALLYTIRILRNVSDISDRAREEVEHLQGDIESARSRAKKAGFLAAIFTLASRFYKRKSKK